ncbi:MAG: N-acetylmuramoyl-L-alanine amidase [Thalassospira sp.]|uniref:N-acetylmuramoyl-L-alanine amidase n=1 Tax=Thalassospira sp. TaxID=1912094 RepID=UPI0032EFB0F9
MVDRDIRDGLLNNVIDHPSANFGPRPDNCPIDILVLHYTGMQSGKDALDRLCDPDSSVSCHYLVEEDGRIFRLVDEDKRAWHAGRGNWQNCIDVNSHSIGIEIVNPGHEFGYRPFPDDQITSVIALCQDILTRHHIPTDRIIAHSDMAPDRKEDPGEFFPWKLLAENGIGLWPGVHQTSPVDLPEFVRLLDQIGYGRPSDDITDAEQDAYRIKRYIAFQRHWRPSDISGVIDDECMGIAQALARKL